MSDVETELRLKVLRKYYDKRDEDGVIQVNTENFGDELGVSGVLQISSQLKEQGLIIFEYYQRGDDKSITGFGRITAKGVDLVEKNTSQARKQRNTSPNTQYITKQIDPDKIFVVHGHDPALLHQTARFLEKLDLKPIILFEQPGQSQTIIEKIEKHSNVSFAVILLTPDDVGKAIKDENLQPRARQNVILELGYFLGKLGRPNVVALYYDKLELPSDYHGVEYIKVDTEGAWKMKLARELKEAGLPIDINKAI